MFQGVVCRSLSRRCTQHEILIMRKVTSTLSCGPSGAPMMRAGFMFRSGASAFCRYYMSILNTTIFDASPSFTPRRCIIASSSERLRDRDKNDKSLEFTAEQATLNDMSSVMEPSVDTDFEFDPISSMHHDVAVDTAKKSFDRVLYELLPSGAPASAAEKVRSYLLQHPIDILITQPRVQVTHLENAETGAEEKVSLSPVPLSDALEQARLRSMCLVQMGTRDDLAFCRIRNEHNRVKKLIEPEMQLMANAEVPKNEFNRPQKLRPLIEHSFRDVVDSHFVSWKSKKICEDMRKGHPVRLSIKEFQSAEAAMHKLQEMCNAIKAHAESNFIYHNITSIVGNEREASVSLSPSLAQRVTKHPTEKGWEHALRRMEDACQKSGRVGTYLKTGRLKPRNVGATIFRVDKYGRRVD